MRSTTRFIDRGGWRIGVSAVLLTLSAGCTDTKMVAPPPIFADVRANPFEWMPESSRTNQAEVIIVSDRKAISTVDGKYRLENDFGYETSAALAHVQLGDKQDSFDVATNESLRGRDRPDMSFVSLTRMGRIAPMLFPEPHERLIYEAAQQALIDRINQNMADGGLDEVLVFVHGFYTLLSDNSEIAAQLWHFGGRRGAVISYEWPSKFKLLDYNVDKQNAARSTRSFRLLLEAIATRTNARRIDIVVHSAGGQIVAEAMQEIALKTNHLSVAEAREQTKLGTVVFAAGDIDQVEFVNYLLDGMHRIAQRIQIYSSARDKALSISAWLFGQRRLGTTSLLGGPPGLDEFAYDIRQTVTLVDVSAAQAEFPDFLGHSYFYLNPWVLSDLMLTLRTDLPPGERGLEAYPQSILWHFPKDYEDRARGLGVLHVNGGTWSDRYKARQPIAVPEVPNTFPIRAFDDVQTPQDPASDEPSPAGERPAPAGEGSTPAADATEPATDERVLTVGEPSASAEILSTVSPVPGTVAQDADARSETPPVDAGPAD